LPESEGWFERGWCIIGCLVAWVSGFSVILRWRSGPCVLRRDEGSTWGCKVCVAVIVYIFSFIVNSLFRLVFLYLNIVALFVLWGSMSHTCTRSASRAVSHAIRYFRA